VSDLALHLSDAGYLAADLAVEANDLAQDAGLRTAILLSLFTDRRADDGDILPPGETDRRGYWGDSIVPAATDRIGSRLWLLAREKATETTRARADEYAAEALEWLTEDRVAERVAVAADYFHPGMLGIRVIVHRPQGDTVTFYFQRTWAAEG
jgi:phage gp46-like protein